MAYHSSILNCWGGKNCAGADPRFSFWQLQVYPSTDPRRCHVCPACCLSSILGGREVFVCWSVCVCVPVPVCAGQVLATLRSVQMRLGHLDRGTTGDCKWQKDEWALFCQFFLPVLFRGCSFEPGQLRWSGGVTAGRSWRDVLQPQAFGPHRESRTLFG